MPSVRGPRPPATRATTVPAAARPPLARRRAAPATTAPPGPRRPRHPRRPDRAARAARAARTAPPAPPAPPGPRPGHCPRFARPPRVRGPPGLLLAADAAGGQPIPPSVWCGWDRSARLDPDHRVGGRPRHPGPMMPQCPARRGDLANLRGPPSNRSDLLRRTIASLISRAARGSPRRGARRDRRRATVQRRSADGVADVEPGRDRRPTPAPTPTRSPTAEPDPRRHDRPRPDEPTPTDPPTPTRTGAAGPARPPPRPTPPATDARRPDPDRVRPAVGRRRHPRPPRRRPAATSSCSRTVRDTDGRGHPPSPARGHQGDPHVRPRVPRLHRAAGSRTSARPSPRTPTSSRSSPTKSSSSPPRPRRPASRGSGPSTPSTADIDGVDQRVDADVAIVDTGIAKHPRPQRGRWLQLLQQRPHPVARQGGPRHARRRHGRRAATTTSGSSASPPARACGPSASSTTTATACCPGTSAAWTGSSPSATRTTRPARSSRR